jgi:hypothetical protein
MASASAIVDVQPAAQQRFRLREDLKTIITSSERYPTPPDCLWNNDADGAILFIQYDTSSPHVIGHTIDILHPLTPLYVLRSLTTEFLPYRSECRTAENPSEWMRNSGLLSYDDATALICATYSTYPKARISIHVDLYTGVYSSNTGVILFTVNPDTNEITPTYSF